MAMGAGDGKMFHVADGLEGVPSVAYPECFASSGDQNGVGKFVYLYM